MTSSATKNQNFHFISNYLTDVQTVTLLYSYSTDHNNRTKNKNSSSNNNICPKMWLTSGLFILQILHRFIIFIFLCRTRVSAFAVMWCRRIRWSHNPIFIVILGGLTARRTVRLYRQTERGTVFCTRQLTIDLVTAVMRHAATLQSTLRRTYRWFQKLQEHSERCSLAAMVNNHSKVIR